MIKWTYKPEVTKRYDSATGEPHEIRYDWIRENEKVIAAIVSYPEEQRQAHAALITAAPDLLAALEQAYKDCLWFLNYGDFKRDIEFDAGYIVDALAKARGES